MIDKQGQIKLIDFSLARTFKPGKRRDIVPRGTPDYAPPEQYGNAQTDARSDIYSLGVTLFSLFTGQDPASYTFDLPSVRQFNPSVSPQLEQVIVRATQLDPKQRYQNIQDVKQALLNLKVLSIVYAPPAASMSKPTPSSKLATPPSSRPSQGSSVAPTARPTTRLVQATVKFTAQLSNAQLAGIGAALLAIILFSVWFITPRIQGTWFWYRVPTIALLGPAIFAATRRRGVAGIGHGVVATVAGSLTWYRAGLAGDYSGLFLGAVLSGAAIESFLYFLPKITAGLKREDPETWKREAGWLGLAAVVGHILLLGLAFSFGAALHMFSLTAAFVLGCLGWFIGDLIYSAWMEKQKQP